MHPPAASGEDDAAAEFSASLLNASIATGSRGENRGRDGATVAGVECALPSRCL
jgi:hypothetical protein